MRRVWLPTAALVAACFSEPGSATSQAGSTDSGGPGGPSTATGFGTGGSESGVVDGGSTGVGTLCGDGNIDAGEQCDDGNDVNGDGCNVDCLESGQEVWTRRVGVGIGDDFAHAVAVDGEGNTIVAGSIAGAGGVSRLWIGKYDPDGEELWTVTSNSIEGGGAEARGVVVIDGGFVVVGSEGPQPMHRLRASGHTDDGVQVWIEVIEPPPDQSYEPRSVTATVDGFAAAGSLLASQTVTRTPFVSHFLRPSGTPDWEWTGAPGDDTELLAIIPAGMGSTLSCGSAGAGAAADSRFLTLDAAGGVGDDSLVDVPGQMLGDGLGDCRITSDGELVVVGSADNGMTGVSGFAAKIPIGRGPTWVSWIGTGATQDLGAGVAVGSDGSVAALVVRDVAGQALNIFVRKFDADGNELWDHEHNGRSSGIDLAGGIATGPDDYIHVVGTEATATGTDIWIRKLTP